MFNWFKKPVTSQDVEKKKDLEHGPVIVEVKLPVPGLIVPGQVVLRAKKWVIVKGQVGIVVGVDTSGYVKVDVTNDKGETTGQVRVPVGEVRLAKYLEIPEPRRGDKVKAATLGYV